MEPQATTARTTELAGVSCKPLLGGEPFIDLDFGWFDAMSCSAFSPMDQKEVFAHDP